MDKDLIMKVFTETHKKGSKVWGAFKYLIYYGAIDVRTLSEYPICSNAANKLIQIIKEFCEENRELGVLLNWEWKQNEKTKSRYKEFYLEEA